MTTIYNINKDIYNTLDSEVSTSKKSMKYFEKIHEYNTENKFVDFNSKTDRFGSVVALSGDGNTMAVSAPYYSTYVGGIIKKLMCGLVVIYIWNDNRWDQIGQQLIGKESYFKLGISMDLSYDGSKIVIGSAYNPLGVFLKIDTIISTDEGITPTGFISQITDKVFNEWKLNPNNDPNNYEEEYGVADDDSYSFQPEETYKQNLNAPWVGNVSVYQYESKNAIWMKIFDQDGDTNSEECFGYTVSITSNGSRIIIGSPTYSVTSRYTYYIPKRIGQIVFENFPGTGRAFQIFDVISQIQDFYEVFEHVADVSDFFKKAQKEIEGDELAENFFRPFCWISRRYVRYARRKNIGMVQIFDLANSSDITNATYNKLINNNYLPGGYFHVSNYEDINISAKDVGEAIADGLIDAAAIALAPMTGGSSLALLLLDETHVYRSKYGIHNDQTAITQAFSSNQAFYGFLNASDADGFIGSTMALCKNGDKIVYLSKSDELIKTRIFIKGRYEHMKSNEIGINFNPNLNLNNICLSMSDDGKTLAVGSPSSDIVKLYKWYNDEWCLSPKTSNIIEFIGVSGSLYGSSVSLNNNGTIMAISAPNSNYGLDIRDPSEGVVSKDDINSAGMVIVYKLNTDNEWILMGNPIYGNKNNLLGLSIKLSSNGLTLVIGVPCKHSEHNETYVKGEYGFVRVFRFFDGRWNQNCFDNGQLSKIQTKNIAVIKYIPPVLIPSIQGNKIINLFIGTKYEDPGINLESTKSFLVETISDLNVNKVGYYNIAYITKNQNGHQSYWNREVNVVYIPSFNSKSPIIVYQDDPFDINNGNYGLIFDERTCGIYSRIHNVNTNIIGEYSIELNVRININPYNDVAFTCIRSVLVVSKNKITINGGIQFVKQFNNYDNLGAIIKSHRQDILKNSLIKTSISVNTSVIGIYKVKYSAEYTDTVERTVIVTSPYIKSYEQILHEIN